MVETIWCRVDTLLSVQVSFSRYGGTTVFECSVIFLGESGRQTANRDAVHRGRRAGAFELAGVRCLRMLPPLSANLAYPVNTLTPYM